MDIIRSGIIATLVYIGLNFAIGWVVTAEFSLIYLLCPFVAGLAASMYHAERGSGGWLRHFFAVLIAPVVIAAYLEIAARGMPRDADQAMALMPEIGTAAALALLGLGVVMLTRLLLFARSTRSLRHKKTLATASSQSPH